MARWMVCGLAVAAVVAAAAAEDRITREIARVRAEAQGTVPEGQLGGVLVRLDRAAPAINAGRPFLALYELQPAFETQAAFAFSSASGVTTLAQFVEKWKAVGEPKPAAPDSRRRALVVEALAQGAEGKALATYVASLPYAEDAGLLGGLFYLGESQAFGKFAAFCRSLDLRSTRPAPVLRSLASELKAVEGEILDAYDRAEGTARQPFINISVTLKLARSLDEDGRLPGALLQYLLTRYRFGVARASASTVDVSQALESARRLPKDADHSIAEFFLQLAQANMGTGGNPAIPAVIVDDVLPAYWKVVE